MQPILSLSATTSPKEAAARSGTYSLLARLWLREVDRDLLSALRSPPLRDSFLAAGGALPACDDDRTIEELEIDFCRLFVGPTDHLPPFQSVWQSGQFQSATIASMKSFVDVVDYNIDTLPSGIMLDHLGVQFAVMGHILDQISTWQSGEENLDDVLELAQSFFAKHLMWPAGLLEAAASRATTEFYRSTIALTAAFLKSQRDG